MGRIAGRAAQARYRLSRNDLNKKLKFFRSIFSSFTYICTPERKERLLVRSFGSVKCPSGEIGRRTVFRSQRGKPCVGSNPILGT